MFLNFCFRKSLLFTWLNNHSPMSSPPWPAYITSCGALLNRKEVTQTWGDQLSDTQCMNICVCVRVRPREHKHVRKWAREHLTTSPRLLGRAASSWGYHRTWQTNKRRSFIAQISSALMVTQMSDRRTACLSWASMWRCWGRENILTMICSSRESIATMLSKYVLYEKNKRKTCVIWKLNKWRML